ncbi:MAG: SAM-dependent methyltransferase, partial [Burkholderiales bacterium]
MNRRRLLLAFAAAAVALPTCAQQSATETPARSPDVPYVPTRQEVVEEMLRMAGVKPGDVV